MTKAVEKVKEVIENNIEDALYGIFDCRNVVGDPMETIYNEAGLELSSVVNGGILRYLD